MGVDPIPRSDATPPRVARTRRGPSPEEARALLDRGRPFHLATLLRTPAVDVAPSELREHLALPVEVQQERLTEALVEGGISARVARAVASVPRHRIVPREHRDRAYLDEFHKVSGWSGLTPPSLVATMLERLELDPERPARVLELGVGSGFHALALLELAPRSTVVGVEVERDLVERARATLRRLGGAPSLTLLHGDSAETARDHGPFDRIYATFAVRHPAAQALPLLREDGLAQIPRCVTPHEFEREPTLEHLHERYPSYESFLEDWQKNLCLTTYRRRGDQLRVEEKLFGVSFVGERTGEH